MQRSGKKSFVVIALFMMMFMIFATISANAVTKPTKLYMKSDNATVDIGGTARVSVRATRPAKASKAVTWKSSNTKVATVNTRGGVLGKRTGTVYITATSRYNSRVKGVYRIRVKDLKATGVSLSSSSIKVQNGKTATLKATVAGADGLNRTGVVWKSSNTNAVTVSSKGVVTAKAVTGSGTPAIVTASIDGKSASCKVAVTGTYGTAADSDVSSAVAGTLSGTVLVDARVTDAYQGWALGAATKGGHLANAVNFPAQSVTNAVTPNSKEGISTSDYWNNSLADNGMTSAKNYIIYDTNGKDAQEVADFLVGTEGYSASNIKIYNAASLINSSTTSTVSQSNYKLNVPASVVKNISDYMTGSTTSLSDNAKLLVGSTSKSHIKLLHAEYASSGKYTKDGYKADNDIDWSDGTVYASGHVPGSVPISTDDFEPETQSASQLARDAMNGTWTASYSLVDDSKLISLAEKYGINKNDTVILSGPETMSTTRIAIILKYLGVKNVYVMSDELNGWKADGYSFEKTINKPAKVYDFGYDTPQNKDLIDTTAETKNHIADTSNYQVVDSRTVQEWNGTSTGYGYHDIAGRIPGTVSAPCGVNWSSSVFYFRNADRSPINKENLEKYFAKYGLDTSKHLSFFCGSGWRVSEVMWDAMAAGYTNVSIYSDGWQGWSNDGNEFIDKNGNLAALNLNTNTVNSKGLTFAKDTVKVTAQGTYTGLNTLTNNTGDTSAVTYTSNSDNVTVNSSGDVTVNTLKEGTVKITATVGKYSSSYILKIHDRNADNTSDWSSLGIKYSKIDWANDQLLDVRSSDAYTTSHLKGSINIDCSTWTVDAENNLKTAITNGTLNPDKRIVIVCNSGNSIARRAYSYLTEECGLTKTQIGNITYLIGGALNFNEDNSGDIVSTISSKDLNANKSNYVVLDARKTADYDYQHINGAVSADVDGAVSGTDEATAAANVKKVVDSKTTSANYAVVCYTGNKYANAAKKLLMADGVPETNIHILVGGMKDYSVSYSSDLVAAPVVDKTAKTVKIAAKVNTAMLTKPTMHYIVNSTGGQAKNAMMNTEVTTDDFYNALMSLEGAKVWNDKGVGEITFKSTDTIKALAASGIGNKDYSHFDVKVTWGGNTYSMKDTLKDSSGNAATDSNLETVFSGNLKSQQAWKSGCITCSSSCYAGITSNEVNPMNNPFQVNTTNLPDNGNTVVYVTYTLK